MSALPIVLMTEEEVAALGRDSDAGFGALRTERGLLPLAAMDVDARVAGVVASIDVAQTFVNTTGQAIEATYIFPLPDRAAVHRFRMEVAGRVIEGVVDERGAARERYDEAIAKGHRAAITEEERAGVFTLRVGNLMPGEAATVRLSLVGALPVDDGEVTFRFPLVVAPRYMPGSALGGDQAGLGTAADTDLVPDASRISPPVLLPGCPNPVRLGLRVSLEDALISDVASSLHAVTSRNRDARIIEVQPGERLDRDFILRWRVGGRELASSLVCVDDGDGKAGTFMLTFVPPTTVAVAAKPRDVVFLLDRSGSMEGWKMVAARRALGRMIDTLTSRDRFSVIAFDDRVENIPASLPGAGLGSLASATDRTRFRAVEAIAKIDSRGGTELAEPLELAMRAFGNTYDDRERVIVLVTDGQVGNEDHLLRSAANGLKNIRMFTLGIDQAVNAAFLKRLASAGGGLCELVESEDRLDQVMAKVHRRIGVPVATELAISASGLDLARATITPKKLPDVYAGSPVVIFGRYGGTAPTDATIAVEGTSFGDPLKLTIARDPIARGPAGWLGASWARAYIRDLEDRYAAGDHSVEPTIISTSKQFTVLSRFTAFLAVDTSEIVNKGGRVNQVVQPVDAPAGWDMKTDGYANAIGGAGYGQAQTRAPGGAMKTLAAAMPRSLAQPQLEADFDDEAADVGESLAEAGMAFDDLDAARSVPPPAQAALPRRQTATRSAPMAPPPPAAARPMGPPGAFSPPPAPSAPPMMPKMPAPKPAKKAEAEERAREVADKDTSKVAGNAYLVQLAQLARELAAHAGGPNASAIRLLRQRLTEWVEDLRSVGGQAALADAVEKLVQRLAAALASTDLGREAKAIADELAQLAGGAPPPEPAKKSRLAFWK
ncbi:MAG: VWA domain-containing protein [Deltaproteobacteria bacterium]|nr:VWA domain-containing protein [Deltaproteobacteria bacterium]